MNKEILKGIINDDVEKKFESDQELTEFLAVMDDSSRWICLDNSKKISLRYAGTKNDVIPGITDEAFNDTVTNGTRILITVDGEEFCLGASALPTLKARANNTKCKFIGGLSAETEYTANDMCSPELKTLIKNYFNGKATEAELFCLEQNIGLFKSKGGAMARLCGDKIRAVHGKDYKDISQSFIIRVTKASLSNYDNVQFIKGLWTHDNLYVSWDIGDNNIKKQYADIIESMGRTVNPNDIKTTVSISTSDTGTSELTFWYSIQENNNTIVLGSGTRLKHKGTASIEKFENMVKEAFSLYNTKFIDLCALSKIDIEYPVGCIYNMLKRADLPKKVYEEAAIKYKNKYGNYRTDGLSLYINGITSVLKEIPEGKKSIAAQEKVARVLNYKFKDFDEQAKIDAAILS